MEVEAWTARRHGKGIDSRRGARVSVVAYAGRMVPVEDLVNTAHGMAVCF
jgi:hypothetical protein